MISGTTIIGNKPFAAFSGNMAGYAMRAAFDEQSKLCNGMDHFLNDCSNSIRFRGILN